MNVCTQLRLDLKTIEKGGRVPIDVAARPGEGVEEVDA
jgi:hypothetical protein